MLPIKNEAKPAICPIKNTLWVLLFFSLSMAYLEASVVVYLRELFYPEGFRFPLKLLPSRIFLIEIGREAATIVMVIAVGMVTGKTRWSKFSCFMFVFGVWDIFYYLWLKVLIDWPSSLLEWDILFLIPLPWIGPVMAPMIVAASMAGAALVILFMEEKGVSFCIKKRELFFVALGASTILLSFLWDAGMAMEQGIPKKFQWGIFGFGEFLGLIFFFRAARRNVARNS